MKPVIQVCVLLFSISCALAFAQPTPQQIQQHQMAVQRELQQREQEQRDQQAHQAQMEQMRQIDRQQAEDAHEQAEKARAKAIATQENLFLLQQQELQKAQARAKSQATDRNAPQPVPRPAVQPTQTAPSAPETETLPAQTAAASHWSFNNMTNLDKAGLAALGMLLIALAYAAGIIPAKRISNFRNPR